MIIVLIVGIAITVGIIITALVNKAYVKDNDNAFITLGFIAFICLLVGSVGFFFEENARVSVNTFNQLKGTEYTTEQWFWSKDMIIQSHRENNREEGL